MGLIGFGTQSELERDVTRHPGLFWDWLDLGHRENERGTSQDVPRRPGLFWDWLDMGHREDGMSQDIQGIIGKLRILWTLDGNPGQL